MYLWLENFTILILYFIELFLNVFMFFFSVPEKCGLGEEPKGGHGTQDGQPE